MDHSNENTEITYHHEPSGSTKRIWKTFWLLLILTGYKTVDIARVVAPFAGVLGCGLWCLAMVWVERTQLPAAFRMSRWLFVSTLVAGLVMTAVGCYVTVLSWL